MIVSAATLEGPGSASSSARAASSTCTTPTVARPPSSSGRLLARGDQAAELVDDRQRLGPVVLDGARPIDDSEPAERELEAGPPRLQAEHELAVDLRQVRQVVLGAVRRVGPDRAREPGSVHVERATEHDRRAAASRHRLGHEPDAGRVRLLRVVGLALGDGPARLRGEEDEPIGSAGEEPGEIVLDPDVRALDAGPALLEPGELGPVGRVPVVRENDLVAAVERELGDAGADIPSPQHQEPHPTA